MNKGVMEYVAEQKKLVELADMSGSYGHFALRCACDGIEPWTESMFNLYKGCSDLKKGEIKEFDVWKALSE